MKETGLVRKVDKLGRVVIPKEWRKQLDIGEEEDVDIRREDDMIIIKKYVRKDTFTGDTEDLVEYEGKWVSKKSIKEMAKLAGII
ncbi:MAG: AbrB/MazE/SpoVT family DNA-binding domain-containing protein [Lachnospiraceae bacterium]|nr:AbrB/MazE/SpoVT family DNA-binding domain-containing protein [Lachnospiraceae bacterium]